MNKCDSFQGLEVYRHAFQLQQRIFELSVSWPKTEVYALIDQVRRSSRSIGANLAEAWAKRRYPAHFRSKLTDADGELQETLHWIESAFACGYLPQPEYQQLLSDFSLLGRRLGAMINRSDSFCF